MHLSETATSQRSEVQVKEQSTYIQDEVEGRPRETQEHGLLKDSSAANCQYQDLNLRVVHWAHGSLVPSASKTDQPPGVHNKGNGAGRRREIQFLHRDHDYTLEDA